MVYFDLQYEHSLKGKVTFQAGLKAKLKSFFFQQAKIDQFSVFC